MFGAVGLLGLLKIKNGKTETMIIALNDFGKWRAKKFCLFCICVLSAIMPGVLVKNGKMIGLLIIISLGVYGYIVQQPFFNRDFTAVIETDRKNIYIKINKKVHKIERDKIEKVSIREVMYGGKWLEVIGYRLTICTTSGQCHFDSALKMNPDNKCEDIIKLYDLLRGEDIPLSQNVREEVT